MTHRIDGHARTVKELLKGAKFAIDFYQREYAWKERQARELVDDLTGKFLDFYRPEHERIDVAKYGHYFLGPVVISHKREQRFIVDGQQRLTTLTLLLIFLHHKRAEGAEDVRELIYSSKFGQTSFNLDVPTRAACMKALLEGKPFNPEGASESVRNIAARYETLQECFPDDDIPQAALPFFIDWLTEHVHFVEIEAYSDEDAYTIFETMNDRGLSLSLPEMLKGYVLANIRDEVEQRRVNDVWKGYMLKLKELGEEEDVDFFKNWLRGRHADTIRPGNKGAENRDYERIGSEFHRWVRDNKDPIGLTESAAFVRFVERDMDFYARQTLKIRAAAASLTPGLESVRYNEERGLTLQTQVLLAALEPGDDDATIKAKLRLVADYLDIWLARRVWNFRQVAYSSIKYTLFLLTKGVRGKDPAALSAYLRGQLDEGTETFATQPDLRLHQQNFRQVRHILARLSDWVDVRCGMASRFEDLVSQGRGRPFEIEHIWEDHYERFADQYGHPSEFERERNRIGGLVLLQRGHNQSLGDKPYPEKRDAYLSHGHTLLTQSLHPSAYKNHPRFRALIDETGLGFTPYESFGVEEQRERQELYLRLAEWVWNPSRLDLDGERPPVHEPLVDPEELSDGGDKGKAQGARHHLRERFFAELLSVAKVRSDLHAKISPSRYSWVGARRHGQWWNYTVRANDCRAELYIDSPSREANTSVYDALFAARAEVEAVFGGPLEWQRLDDKRACRICYRVPGGWQDEAQWPDAIDGVTRAMTSMHAALGPRVAVLSQAGSS